MPKTGNGPALADGAGTADGTTEVRRQNALLKAGALQKAILTSANFSIIATDEKGIIQLFNVGAERMLGYTAAEVVNRISPSDIHDPQEVIAHAQAVSLEVATTIAPGFEALAFKASRGIEDIYELTYIRKDGSRFPAELSVTALRDEGGQIIGYLLIGTDITQRKMAEEDLRRTEWRLRYATESARLTYVEADLVRGGARTPENFAAVMGYVAPPEQEADISAGTRFLLEHVVPDDRLRVTAAHEEFLLGTPAGKLDYRVLGDDQVERWIETRWSVEFSRDGKPLKSFATNLDITERKNAEQQIRESEERYRTLFNSMDEGYCIIEMIFDEHEKPIDWRFLEVNPSFAEQNGLHEATGKRMRELAPDIEAHWFEIYGKVAVTGESIRFVSEAKALDGRWFDLYAFRIGGSDSYKVAVLFTNITERKLAEKALRDSEERFRAFVTASSDVMYRMSPDWSEMRQLHGRNTLADTNKPSRTWLQEYIHPDDQSHVMAVINEAVRTRSIFKLEHRVRHLDGTVGWTFSRAVPMLDAKGEIVEWFGAASDVTERKRAEKTLRESEERYRTLFNSIDEGFCVIEMIFDEHDKPVDWCFLEVNPTFEKQTGLLEATGKRMRELVPDLEEHWFKIYGKVALTGEPVRFVNQAKAMNNCLFDAYACRVGEPDSRKVAIVFNEISERRQSETALRQSYAELQAHVEELDRFNRVAVGRELRMIELKKELNELCQQQGNAARYPLEFEQDGKHTDA